MKTLKEAGQKAFTMMEMMIVVVVIGLLIAIAIPGIKNFLKNGQLTNAIGTADGVKKAVLGLVTKSGGPNYPPLTKSASTAAFPLTGSNLSAASAATISKAATLDMVLITEQQLESPININLGNGANTPVTGTHPLLWNPTSNTFYTNPDSAPDYDYSNVPHVDCLVSTTNVPGTDGTNYFLDPSGNSLPANSRVVTLVIPNVQGTDAAKLANKRDNITTASPTAANTTGTVAYAAPNATTGLTTVYMYITHF